MQWLSSYLIPSGTQITDYFVHTATHTHHIYSNYFHFHIYFHLVCVQSRFFSISTQSTGNYDTGSTSCIWLTPIELKWNEDQAKSLGGPLFEGQAFVWIAKLYLIIPRLFLVWGPCLHKRERGISAGHDVTSYSPDTKGWGLWGLDYLARTKERPGGGGARL